MGRKKNPFLSKKYSTKTFPYIKGRIYNYSYLYFGDNLFNEYIIYLDLDEIKEMNKECDICHFSLNLRKAYFGEEFAKSDIPVKFTSEEFKNFKRTKIIENLSNE